MFEKVSALVKEEVKRNGVRSEPLPPLSDVAKQLCMQASELSEVIIQIEYDVSRIETDRPCGQSVDCMSGSEHARILAVKAIRLASALQACANEIKYIRN